MKILQKVVPDSFNVFHISDDHEGTAQKSEKALEKMFDMVSTDYGGVKENYVTHGGDHIEARSVDHPYYDPKIHKDNPGEQNRQWIKQFDPIKDKLLFLGEGNHPYSLWRVDHFARVAAQALGVPYGSWDTKLSFINKNGNVMFKLFSTHGARNISSTADDPKRRVANMELILKRLLRDQSGDCAIAIMGHTHKLLVCKPEKQLYLYDDGKTIKSGYFTSDQGSNYIHPDHKWYVNTGSFLKKYVDDPDTVTYPEKYGMAPIDLGFAVTRVRDREIVGVDLVTL